MSNQISKKKRLKILLVGDSGVGKTSIQRQYIEESFDISNRFPSTFGVDFKIKNLVVNNRPVILTLWDTVGAERFRLVTQSYYTKMDAILFMFSFTDPTSLKNIDYWIKCKRECGSEAEQLVLGNKSDCQRATPIEAVENMALKWSVDWRQVSAKTGEGVKEAVEEAAKICLNNGAFQQKPDVLEGGQKRNRKCL